MVTPTIAISLVMGGIFFAMGLLASSEETPERIQPTAQTRSQAERSGDETIRSTSLAMSHMILPQTAFDSPEGFLMTMSEGNPDREPLLKRMWNHIDQHAVHKKPAPEFVVEPFLLCGLCGICIAFPPPEEPGEAYMVAFVAALRDEGDPTSTPVPCWYFTLEKAAEEQSEHVGQRLITAVRNDPELLNLLGPDPAFRSVLYGEAEQFIPLIKDNGQLTNIFAQSMSAMNYETLIADPDAFDELFKAFESNLEPSVTTLGECRPGHLYANHGSGPRIDRLAFELDIAVELLSRVRGSA